MGKRKDFEGNAPRGASTDTMALVPSILFNQEF